MKCWYCGRDFRAFEYFYVRQRYGRDWSTPRRLACADCRDAGVVDRKHDYLTPWPVLGAKAR